MTWPRSDDLTGEKIPNEIEWATEIAAATVEPAMIWDTLNRAQKKQSVLSDRFAKQLTPQRVPKTSLIMASLS